MKTNFYNINMKQETGCYQTSISFIEWTGNVVSFSNDKDIGNGKVM